MFGRKPSKDRNAPDDRTAAPQANPDDGPLNDDAFFALKQEVFVALIEAIDAAEVLRLPLAEARSRVAAALARILSGLRRRLADADQTRLLDELCDDMLGFGPLERFLVRDDIADIAHFVRQIAETLLQRAAKRAQGPRRRHQDARRARGQGGQGGDAAARHARIVGDGAA